MIINFENHKIEIKLNCRENELFAENNRYLKQENGKIEILSSFFSIEKQVNDTWRYILIHKNGCWILYNTEEKCLKEYDFGKYDKDIDTNGNNIIVLLESPHKDEYDEDFIPIGPAIGMTGRNFYKYFCDYVLVLLNKQGLMLNRKLKYNICFVNPIQYQTSLIYLLRSKRINKEIRNNVWIEIFKIRESEIRDRLNRYNPTYVINGCTSLLKGYINKAGLLKDYDVYGTTHPSSWERSFSSFKKISAT